MRALEPGQLVEIWDKGQAASPVDRALLLLRAAFPALEPADLLKLTVGQRDACLLKLRELTIGSTLDCSGECPRCGERLEFSLACDDILAAAADVAAPPFRLSDAGYEIGFRPLTNADLLAVRGARSVSIARRILLRKAIVHASKDGVAILPDALPPEIVSAIGERISEQDPQSEVRLRLNCPACQHSWAMLFDIVAFLWREISARAERILGEVQQLARTYGWSETEILAMSPARRRFYLDSAN